MRLFGSKGALSIAKELSKENEVTVYVHSINASIINDVKSKIGNAQLLYEKTTDSKSFGKIFAIKYQVLKNVDRSVGKRIASDHMKHPFDLVLVIANEGRSLGQILSSLIKDNRPLTGTIIMEVHDHGFHLYHERSYPALRLILWPLYPLVNLMERLRFKAFDFILSNSKWTASIFEYLYGITVLMSCPNVDFEFFSTSQYTSVEKPYIAFPTVSLTAEHKEIGRKLVEDGIPLVSYGPNEIQGIPYRGFIPEEELPQFLGDAAASLFLFDYEALGLIPIESLAAGTPVITLPKEGPFSELSGLGNVNFAGTYEEMKRLCTHYLVGPKDRTTFESCKREAFKLSSAESCRRLLEKITEMRSN